MKHIIFGILIFLLLFIAFIVFRIQIRRDYRIYKRLTPLSSFLQIIVFLFLFLLPYSFLPSEWPWFWQNLNSLFRILGALIVTTGFLLAFGTMFLFGLKRAFGLDVNKLVQSGIYSVSRNPQVVGGWLMVFGISLQYPSIYSFLWTMVSIGVFHFMVLSEEEHLLNVFGEDYIKYCKQVPRYLISKI